MRSPSNMLFTSAPPRGRELPIGAGGAEFLRGDRACAASTKNAPGARHASPTGTATAPSATPISGISWATRK